MGDSGICSGRFDGAEKLHGLIGPITIDVAEVARLAILACQRDVGYGTDGAHAVTCADCYYRRSVEGQPVCLRNDPLRWVVDVAWARCAAGVRGITLYALFTRAMAAHGDGWTNVERQDVPMEALHRPYVHGQIAPSLRGTSLWTPRHVYIYNGGLEELSVAAAPRTPPEDAIIAGRDP